MNTDELRRVISSLHCLNKCHVEICALNTLPKTTTNRYPQVYIINTDPIPLPGEHWISVLMLDTMSSEYFDSLGKPAEFYGDSIQKFISENSQRCFYILQSLQDPNSDVCGQYVLFFILMRVCLSVSMKKMYEMFGDNLKDNDYFMTSYLSDLLKA